MLYTPVVTETGGAAPLIPYKLFYSSREATDHNTELNHLRKTICLRESEVIAEIFSVCDVLEKCVKHVKSFNSVLDVFWFAYPYPFYPRS